MGYQITEIHVTVGSWFIRLRALVNAAMKLHVLELVVNLI